MLSLFQSKLVRGCLGLVAIAASAMLGAGCSDSETISQGNPLESEEGFCQAVAQAECSASIVSACFDTSRTTAQTTITRDTATCVSAASRTAVCNPNSLPYHAEAAAAAVKTVTTIYADGVLTVDELPTLELAMATVFNRGEAKGSHCQFDNDCDAANELSCILHDGKGVCGKPSVVAPGDSCALVNQACDSDHFCDSSLSCAAKHKPSSTPSVAKCSGDFECASGTACKNSECHSLAGDGFQCAVGTDCANSFCIKATGDEKFGHCASEDKFNSLSTSCDAFLPAAEAND